MKSMFVAGLFFIGLILTACGPPPPAISEETVNRYYILAKTRADEYRSAAYLIDLRINDAGNKFSTTTELYFAGDSVGFYGRGYLGKGAFKGSIIDDLVTIYFKSQNEYFSAFLSDIRNHGECPGPGEILLLMLSRLSFKDVPGTPEESVRMSRREFFNNFGRFDHMVRLQGKGGSYPKLTKLTNPICGDSIIIRYDSFSNDFPYYQPVSLLYHNSQIDFRARGFMRERRYNIPIGNKKFALNIPASAVRIESF
ncbi:MAG: hypothetical protein GY841_22830 [FCB group bacterium]|nr:hypothetical protein [FCB group bacterium]